jgi:hypothetical protein
MGDLDVEPPIGTVRLPYDPLKYGHLKSTRGMNCVVLFRNSSDRPLRVVWVDFNGLPVQYTVLHPDQVAYELFTFDTHPWVLEDLSGDVFCTYVGASCSNLLFRQFLKR